MIVIVIGGKYIYDAKIPGEDEAMEINHYLS